MTKKEIVNKLLFLIVIVICAFVGKVVNPYYARQSKKEIAEISDSLHTAYYKDFLKKELDRFWHISKVNEYVTASVISQNKVDMGDKALLGRGDLTMVICKKNHKINIIFFFGGGRLNTDLVSICFDEEESANYNVVERGNSGLFFIKKASDRKKILSKCKMAHTIKVQTSVISDSDYLKGMVERLNHALETNSTQSSDIEYNRQEAFQEVFVFEVDEPLSDI